MQKSSALTSLIAGIRAFSGWCVETQATWRTFRDSRCESLRPHHRRCLTCLVSPAFARRHLFTALEAGGFYIIGDLHRERPEYEAALPAVPETRCSERLCGRSAPALAAAPPAETYTSLRESPTYFVQVPPPPDGHETTMIALQKASRTQSDPSACRSHFGSPSTNP